MILGVFFAQELGIEIWFKTGTKEKVCFIPLHEISSFLGQELTLTLLAFHAITGCDSTSCFKGKGKKRSLLVLKNSVEEFKDLRNLGSQFPPTTELLNVCERFVCRLYQQQSDSDDINLLRYKIFCKTSQQNQSLPPCKDSLIQHLLRANYQCAIWRSAIIPKPQLPSPIGNGWKESSECVSLAPVLTKQSAAPEEILELTVCRCKASKCSRKSCKCFKNGLNCTSACVCEADEELCENELNNANSRDTDSSDTDSDDTADKEEHE